MTGEEPPRGPSPTLPSVPLFDLPLAELTSYRPEVASPDDLTAFWQATLDSARQHDLACAVEPVDNKLAVIDTFDLTFAGFGGTPVHGWIHLPRGAAGPLPTVVQYHGYSGGRGFPHATTTWAQAGWAHVVMDTRGQGWSAGGPSNTPDWAPEAGLVHTPGFMTAGITEPETYYYRRVFTDAVRLIEAVAGLELVDQDKIILTGGSQGGGITIAAAGLAALSGIDLAGVAPDVPFLCHFERAVQITDRHPYAEITEFLAAWREHAGAAYRTLGYFDGVNLGRLATAPTLFSVGLMDEICPPSTVYAAFNHYGGQTGVEKSIVVYPHNGHEGGGPYQIDAQLDWFAAAFRTG